MKVWQLKKINEYAQEEKVDLDYPGLLALEPNDVDTIIDLIDAKNKNASYVILFMIWVVNHPNWKNDLELLMGIDPIDIKEYLITMMSNAPSDDISSSILDYFDFDSESEKLKNFKNIYEWQTYVESIGGAMEENHEMILSNLEFILEKTEDYSDRYNLIKSVMEYSQRSDLNPESLNEHFSNIEIEKHVVGILDLLLKGYDIDGVECLFENWDSDISELSVTNLINENYEKVVTYLKESTLFDYTKDSTSLIQVFELSKVADYDDIISLLKDIEEKEDRELFEYCLDRYYPLANPTMRAYTRKILAEKDEDKTDDYRRSLLYLLDKSVIASPNFCESKENILKIQQILELAQLSDGTSMEMAEFIGEINHVSIISDIKVTEENRNTRRMLYNTFPSFIISKSLSTSQMDNYADWLKKLSELPSDICLKVMHILNIPLIKNMDIELQEKIKEIVLNPENFGSLDYIYNEYENKEKNYRQTLDGANISTEYDRESLTKLTTVLELLENGNNLDIALDGFDKDDEITPKTLIRSMEYKNNQN